MANEGEDLWTNAAPLTFSELQSVNVARCQAPKPGGFNHSLESWSQLEWAGAMCGEAGEAANIAKKMIRFRDNVAGNKEGETIDALRVKLGREVADTIIYGVLLLAREGLDAGDEVRKVFNAKSRELGSPFRL